MDTDALETRCRSGIPLPCCAPPVGFVPSSLSIQRLSLSTEQQLT